jgi:TolB-like protein
MNRIRKAGIVLGVFILILSGCTENRKAAFTIPAGTYSKKLLILPFSTVKSKDKIVSCPVCGVDNPAGVVAAEAKGVLTDLLINGLLRRGYQVVPMEKVAGEISRIGGEKAWRDIVFTSKTLARKLGVSLIVAGVVFAYRSREGEALGVTKPAMVSFSLHLIRGKDGRVIWADRYHETQQALSEDIANIGKFLKRRGTWVTAERLARDGITALLDRFPDIQ